jgi:hypothetical protein
MHPLLRLFKNPSAIAGQISAAPVSENFGIKDPDRNQRRVKLARFSPGSGDSLMHGQR